MPPRIAKNSFEPPNDTATYRDILLFEERLKTNAANLQRRKSRYQLFLLQLLAVIAFLLYEVILPPQTSLLSIPYRMLLERLLPDVYEANPNVTLHPYIGSGLLFVSVTTLVLVFASGMYAEKIAYANKYVPHANKALRSLNMYLNVRKPPLRSKLKWNPLAFFFPRPEEAPSSPPTNPTTQRPRARSASTTRPIHTIPPATHPRGELIFSSRVPKDLREGYERYRSAFERRREEKEYAELIKRWYGRLLFWRRPPPPAPPSPPTPLRTRTSSNASARGRVSRSGTPPIGQGGGDGIVMKQRDRSRSPTSSVLRWRGNEDMRTIVLEKTVAHVDR